MSQPHLRPDARFWCAATLAERLATPPTDTPPAGDPARAARRAQRWRQEPVFAAGVSFEERLASDGLDEARWLALLGETPEELRARLGHQAWIDDLHTAYAEACGLEVFGPEPANLQGRRADAAGLLVAAAPAVRRFRARLEAGLAALERRHAALPFDPGWLRDKLLAALPGLLLPRLDRVLVLEMHVARLEGRLSGEDGATRYANYLERLADPRQVLALWAEYPVLARQLWSLLETWLAANLELAERLCADWPALVGAFAANREPGRLEALEVGAGDRHRGGRTVALLRFSSGWRVVYKPKPLSIDAHFQELLAWAGASWEGPPLRTLGVLARDGYGWLEFAAPEPCGTAAQVQRFYERQGGLLMLLYLLGAADFHYENLVACGEQPVLVDLETVLHPRFAVAGNGPERLAQDGVQHSVLACGLLPQWIWGDERRRGIEISGLGAAAGQRTPFDAPAWAAAGTDDMRWTRRPSELAPGRHRPTLDGREADPGAHVEDVARGFGAMYRMCLRQRAALAAADGPLARFAGDELRVIARPSQRYSSLLHDSFHPDLLRDELDRERFFDRLWAETGGQPRLRRLLPAERADLQRCDLPLFTARADARDLFTSDRGCLPEAFEQSALAEVHQRLARLDAVDCERQLWLVRAALATLTDAAEGRRPTRAARVAAPVSSASSPLRPPSARVLEARAFELGRRLEDLALRGPQDVAWIGLALRGLRTDLAPADLGLYNGLPGIALFLAQLGRLPQGERFELLARQAVATWLRRLEREGPTWRGVGAFDGWGGVVYALMQFASLWDDGELWQRAEGHVTDIETRLAADEHYDVISGAAGAAVVLLTLDEWRPSAAARRVAAACGAHLLAHALERDDGTAAWPAPVEVFAPLTGFAHGAGGIAWALQRLAWATGDARLAEAAGRAIAYERAQFVPAAGNWPDWRHSAEGGGPDEPFFGLGWCHGAPGVGLGRLELLSRRAAREPGAPEGALVQEACVALETTRRHGFGDNHSLCHGDLGNLELLLEAARCWPDEPWELARREHLAALWADVERRGWVCGTPRAIETPGLMMGLAGIGYGLLRQAAPGRVPSLLRLAAPCAAPAAAGARSDAARPATEARP